MNVYTQMQAVQKTLASRGITKTGYNDFGEFKFRGIDEVLNVLGPILAEHSLMVIPNVYSSEVVRVQTSTGKPANHWTVKVRYTFCATSGDDPSVAYVTEFHGEAYDNSDKGLGKAITSAYKSMLFETFCVPIEGMDDADSSSIEESGFLSSEQITLLTNKMALTKTKPAAFMKWLGYETLGVTPEKEFGKALNALEQKERLMQSDNQSEKGEV